MRYTAAPTARRGPAFLTNGHVPHALTGEEAHGRLDHMLALAHNGMAILKFLI